MKISLDKTIRSISLALDLAEISSVENKNIIENISNINYSKHNFMNHSQRATYISLSLANYLNLSDSSKKYLYLSTLLHDIGATNSLKISHTQTDFIKKHCINGSEILQGFPIFNNLSHIILNHHENFNGTGPLNLKMDEIPIESQIIRLSDLVELLYNAEIPIFKQRDYIINWVMSHSGDIFSPKICNAFVKVSSKDVFWFDLENISFIDSILDNIAPKLGIYLNLEQFESIAYIFSNIIDSKSTFTATHSREIAKLAFKISKYLGYSNEKCHKIKIAGLLHDIGKLAIPSSILDKNGKLTPEEFSIIKSHVYYTNIILSKIGDIPDIKNWASNHHEKLNGTGYPNGYSAKDLSEECRILAVCDIFQALTEDRPYRKGLNNEEAYKILDNMVEKNFICKKAVNNLKEALS
ncbi:MULTISPECIES: HD-GYP domain-containing protein [Clostridium]|uniref:Fusion HD-GYP domain and HD-hydrolase domain n=1 Tax=Clostridium novyi (strain NT) TaxID=386415 RepID=A0Q2W9_CLONN|nr:MULTISPECIES: HD domain-containing phosphohydrolase [Clostridium]ABK62489.1 fusion HD-GYP domain and HD-hydrolase domain [Clostridium novyi NT]KEH84848.1 hydrolase [Clostridium novyi A str. NCTC 538]KEH89772.1 hydrolase [Clostridium novyi A str. 4540]KEH90893.1 hydrolase [Clostridium novyi A str. BKT29909]KEH91528.1 hydrolase [Clostridium botulinum C/D str. It1]